MRTASYQAPLSYQQEERLRLLHEFPESAQDSDCVFLFSLSSGVDVRGLSAAIDDLVLRHPALRTSINGVAQRIHPRPIAPVAKQRIQGSADDLATMLRFKRYIYRDVVAGNPLFRAAIYETPDMMILAFTIHHLVHDGWSESVMWDDLSECYAARAEGRQLKPEPMSLTYADFAMAQRSAWPAARERVVAACSRERGGVPDSARWPRPPAAHPDGTRTETFRISADVVSQWVRSAHVSPFLVLLSATAAAISRVSGADDFLIGSNTANREFAETWNLVGDLVNTRVLRVVVQAGQAFGDLVTDIKRKWLDSEQYRDFYMDPLLRELGWPELTKVDMLNIPGYFRRAPELGGPAQPLPLLSVAKHRRKIHFTWVLEDKAYALVIKYQTAHVDQAAVRQLGALVRSVLTSEGAATWQFS